MFDRRWMPVSLGFLLAGGLIMGPAGHSGQAQEAPQIMLPPVDQLPEQAEPPDAFEMYTGGKVPDGKSFRAHRQPELLKLFQHYVYGYLPPVPAEFDAKITKEGKVLDGLGTLREVTLSFPPLAKKHGQAAPVIRLLVITPSDAKKPVPVFLALNKWGNETVLPDEVIPMHDDRWRQSSSPPADKRRGSRTDFWCVETLLKRGYGFATFHESDIDPDRKDKRVGLHRCFPTLAKSPNGFGTIGAWAWGLHRAVDYLRTDKAVDRSRICLTGHSRRGKTALWAAATSPHVALVVPHQSGTGGMALSRNNDQETVKRITRVFPHWFCKEFSTFSDKESKLPIDQHLLVALVAPRPLLETAGLKDKWANYDSALKNLKLASPVYEKMGVKGLVGDGVISTDEKITPETVGTIAQVRLDTKHTLNNDYWNRILDFADVQWKTRDTKK